MDGNSVPALLETFDAACALPDPKPRLVVRDTRMAQGVPFLGARERNHFLRVQPHEWQEALAILDQGRPA